MNILLPTIANPFIDPMYARKCRIASEGYICIFVDRNGCCKTLHSLGIAKVNRTKKCVYKDIRKPVEAKKGKKINPLKQSKRKSAGA
jgi:hypothetical protein